MSNELTWELLRSNNSFVVKRSGLIFNSHPSNITSSHSYKYDGLCQSQAIRIIPTATGVQVSRTLKNGKQSKPILIKRVASGKYRAVRIARDLEANGYRLDLIPAAQARVCALLDSFKERKVVAKKMRANKLARLTKNNL